MKTKEPYTTKHIIEKSCDWCKYKLVIHLSTKQYDLLKSGENIGMIFPDMSLDDRELMISGTCGECYDKLFPADEG